MGGPSYTEAYSTTPQDEEDEEEGEEFLFTSTPSSSPTSSTFFTVSNQQRRRASDGGVSGHAFQVHTTCQPSPLSKEATPGSYRGFRNLAMLLFVANNTRLVVENYLKYGLRIGLPFTLGSFSLIPALAVALALPWAHFILSTLLERHRFLPSLPQAVVQGLLVISTLVSPCLLLQEASGERLPPFFLSLGCLMTSTIMSMKLTSMVLVCREQQRKVAPRGEGERDSPRSFPSWTSVGYFVIAPTLCFQPVYPMVGQVRIKEVAKRLGELGIAVTAMWVVVEQYCRPTLEGSLRALDGPGGGVHFGVLVERTLKLSTSAVVVWLLMFYALFHAFLNLLAEVTRFGDRRFYDPWWNSRDLGEYWRTWNRPVHAFLKRHVHSPILRRTGSVSLAAMVVFFVSAAMHEVIVGVPLGTVNGLAFGGMMAQMPLIILTRQVRRWRGEGSGVGNVVFWVSFCIVGQPLMCVIYYYEWAVREGLVPAQGYHHPEVEVSVMDGEGV
ncbi:MAG: MBOAT, membrane-bound O-acyltransferase family-domain-containing protein [Piptocephalis tieghemiana]|nr:MAG: MBOAT, membrane-bound O-acyltransferase family-domain-containing protein [Piptocephalis tieghemiana]